MTLLSRSKGGDQSNLALLALSLAPLLTLEGSRELAKTNEILDPGVGHILLNLSGHPCIWAIVKRRLVLFVPFRHMSGNGGSKCWVPTRSPTGALLGSLQGAPGRRGRLAQRGHYRGPFDPTLLAGSGRR